MIQRMIRAAKLDVSLYEEVEANPGLTSEAMGVVALVSILTGLGSGLGATGELAGFGGFLFALIVGAVVAVIAYLIWAWLAFFIGTRLFKGTADWGELRRTLGYAYTPNALAFLIFVPGVGGLIALIGSLWALVAGVVAVRQALDFDTGKAVLTVIVGWLVAFVVIAVVGGLLGTAVLGAGR